MRFWKSHASVLCLLVLFTFSFTAIAQGQAARQKTQPRKAVPSKPSPPRSLPALRSREDFDRMARVYTDQPYALPHVIFVIDRRDHDKIYYVNSQRFRFHRDFVKGTYLSLENAEDFFKNNYLKANRRFILGTLAWQAPVKRYTYEFWE